MKLATRQYIAVVENGRHHIDQSYAIREAKTDDIEQMTGFLVKLDAHVAGVAPEVLSLNKEGERQLTERLKALVDNGFTRLLVAEVRGTGALVAMGHVQIWHHAEIWDNVERKGMSYALIDDLWVEPDARQSGIGRLIVSKLVDFAAEHGVDELILEYAITNAEAQATWTRLGFRTTGVRAAASVHDVRARLARRRKKQDAE